MHHDDVSLGGELQPPRPEVIVAAEHLAAYAEIDILRRRHTQIQEECGRLNEELRRAAQLRRQLHLDITKEQLACGALHTALEDCWCALRSIVDASDEGLPVDDAIRRGRDVLGLNRELVGGE
jgi:uncharacterized protein YPO0396